MASSGQPTKETPADLPPPVQPRPSAPPSSAQRSAEAQVARDAAPPVKGNTHQTYYK